MFERGVHRKNWPRWVFLAEYGETIREQTRRERERQQLPERVEVVL